MSPSISIAVMSVSRARCSAINAARVRRSMRILPSHASARCCRDEELQAFAPRIDGDPNLVEPKKRLPQHTTKDGRRPAAVVLVNDHEMEIHAPRRTAGARTDDQRGCVRAFYRMCFSKQVCGSATSHTFGTELTLNGPAVIRDTSAQAPVDWRGSCSRVSP